MQELAVYKPRFDALENMKQAVEREIRRKKALGQYIIVVEGGLIKKIDFSVLRRTDLEFKGNSTHK